MSTDPGRPPSTYYVVQFRTTYRSLDDAARSDPQLISAHLAHSAEMHSRGDLIMAGAFLEEGEDLQTMAITTTREAAEAYVAGDPFVAAGKVANHRIRPWGQHFCSAGLNRACATARSPCCW